MHRGFIPDLKGSRFLFTLHGVEVDRYVKEGAGAYVSCRKDTLRSRIVSCLWVQNNLELYPICVLPNARVNGGLAIKVQVKGFLAAFPALKQFIGLIDG